MKALSERRTVERKTLMNIYKSTGTTEWRRIPFGSKYNRYRRAEAKRIDYRGDISTWHQPLDQRNRNQAWTKQTRKVQRWRYTTNLYRYDAPNFCYYIGNHFPREKIFPYRENEPNLARCAIQFSENCLVRHENRGRLRIEREGSRKWTKKKTWKVGGRKRTEEATKQTKNVSHDRWHVGILATAQVDQVKRVRRKREGEGDWQRYRVGGSGDWQREPS